MIIPVGRQGENEAQRIIWPDIVTSWSKLYGDGVFSFAVKRNGDDTPYPAVVTTEDGSLVWVPTNADTANVGFGSCELVYTVGDVIAKSQTWRTEVYPSLTGEGETEPPEPYQSWVDEVIKAGAAAEAAASKPAYIGENGNWYTWDVATKQYADTNVPATGPKGSNDHNELLNRDAANQHPISAITNLQQTLDGKLNKLFGTEKAGQFLIVGDDGNVSTIDRAFGFINYNGYELTVY